MTETIDYSTVGGYGPESTPGHSGSETSRDAALAPGIGPKTAKIHEVVRQFGSNGITCRELEHHEGLGHGAASASLTRLHRAGLIVRLADRRDKQQIYVIPCYSLHREESPYRPNAAYREDRRPMPLERPEPTLESITEDLLVTKMGYSGYLYCAHSRDYAESLAVGILEIVRKYR